jgi:hypothetical protein
MPPTFQFVHDLERTDVWTPLAPADDVLGTGACNCEISGKLKPGVALGTAQAELNLLNQQLKLGEKRLGENFVIDERLILTPLSEKSVSSLAFAHCCKSRPASIPQVC